MNKSLTMAVLLFLALMLGAVGSLWMEFMEEREEAEASSLSQRP